jgi:hypothetical protein
VLVCRTKVLLSVSICKMPIITLKYKMVGQHSCKSNGNLHVWGPCENIEGGGIGAQTSDPSNPIAL